MPYPSLKSHFAKSLATDRLHLAAHSHHLWPDVTFDAHMQAWLDAAANWDGKWPRIMDEIVPEAQRHIAHHLNLIDPTQIVFAPNTHEFVLRLLSALPAGRVPRILTTDSEFHSFARQAARLEEDGLLALQRVPTEPFADFPQRFAQAAAHGEYDMIFVSQVFFNSGYANADLAGLVAAVPDPEALIVIDGYHGFCARPTDLAPIQHRAFYMAGGYKYAMAGEGACFLVCPPGYAPRPRDTGWYAGFANLKQAAGDSTAYFADGQRFAGATFDPSGLYRLNAAMRLLASLDLDATEIHARAEALQLVFAQTLDQAGISGLREADLVVAAGLSRGNFLAYRSAEAASHQARLAASGIVTDVRRDVLRFGFGLYHDVEDVPSIARRVVEALSN